MIFLGVGKGNIPENARDSLGWSRCVFAGPGSMIQATIDVNLTLWRKLCGASLSTPKCVSALKSRCTSPTAKTIALGLDKSPITGLLSFLVRPQARTVKLSDVHTRKSSGCSSGRRVPAVELQLPELRRSTQGNRAHQGENAIVNCDQRRWH